MVGGGPEEGRRAGRDGDRPARPADEGPFDATHDGARGGCRPDGTPTWNGHVPRHRPGPERHRGPGHGRPAADVMKPKSRFLGIGDAPFHFSDESVPAVGVVVQAPGYMAGGLTTPAAVDGQGATELT